MMVGVYLQMDAKGKAQDIQHKDFKNWYKYFMDNRAQHYKQSISIIHRKLKEYYRKREISLQQLSATFRRGDLLGILLGE